MAAVTIAPGNRKDIRAILSHAVAPKRKEPRRQREETAGAVPGQTICAALAVGAHGRVYDSPSEVGSQTKKARSRAMGRAVYRQCPDRDRMTRLQGYETHPATAIDRAFVQTDARPARWKFVARGKVIQPCGGQCNAVNSSVRAITIAATRRLTMVSISCSRRCCARPVNVLSSRCCDVLHGS